MKKTIYTLLTLSVVAMFSMSSCQKDKLTGSSFTATIENYTGYYSKTFLDGSRIKWESGDQIIILNDYLYFGIYATQSSNSTSATFTYVPNASGTGMDLDVGDPECTCYNEDYPEASAFMAIYPADIVDLQHGAVIVPRTQQTTDGSLHRFPMYAQSTSHKLQFKNVFGLLKLSLQKTGTSITSISVTADHVINGNFTIDPEASYGFGEVPPLIYANDNSGSATTTLQCGTGSGIDIEEGQDFYIYLPAGDYSNLSITMVNSDGGLCNLTANATIPIVRSQYTTIELTDNDNDVFVFTDISGLFSVASGQYVQFSPGNLQYNPSSNTWRFATSQFEMIGEQNYNYFTGTTSNWIDLFSWGETTPTTTPSTNYNDYGTFVEWGNYINNGNDGWFTPSAEQWLYLMVERDNASQLYGGATVAGVKGLVLLPDSWSLPAGCSFTPGFAYSNFYNTNTYDPTQWTTMETAGAVFLPAAGAMMFNYSTTDNTYTWFFSHTLQAIEDDENANWLGQIVINIFNALYLALKDANFYWTSTPVSGSGMLNSSDSPAAYIAAFTNLPGITEATNGGDIYSFPDNRWYPDPDSHPDSYINFSEVFDPTSGIGYIPGQYIFQLPLNTPAKGAVRLVRYPTTNTPSTPSKKHFTPRLK